MRLTQRQEWLVARYLRAVSETIPTSSDAVRERVANRLKSHIHQALHRLDNPSPGDADVLAVLDEFGNPAQQATTFLDTYGKGQGPALSPDDGVWLGVCSGLAKHFGVPVLWIRAGAVILGLLGPVALLAYLAAYFEMYFVARTPDTPPIRPWRVAGHLVGVFASAIAMHVGTRAVLYGIRWLYPLLLPGDHFPSIGSWAWIEDEMPFLLFCALSVTLPICVLSALPMTNDWSVTTRRVFQAVLAVYALVLCSGIASYLAGAILAGVEQFAG